MPTHHLEYSLLGFRVQENPCVGILPNYNFLRAFVSEQQLGYVLKHGYCLNIEPAQQLGYVLKYCFWIIERCPAAGVRAKARIDTATMLLMVGRGCARGRVWRPLASAGWLAAAGS